MKDYKIIYYYCQFFSVDPEDRLELDVALGTRNFDNFIKIAKKYGHFYFPEFALVRDKYNNVIGKINVYFLEGFKLIDEFKQED